MKNKATPKTQKSPRMLNALEVYLKGCADNKTTTLDCEAMEDGAYDIAHELSSSKLKKHNPEKLLSLFIDYISKSGIILSLLRKHGLLLTDDKNDAIYQDITMSLRYFIMSLRYNARHENKLYPICYTIADYMTEFLMDHAYKHPTKKLSNMMATDIWMPLLITPWESAKEIKRKYDDISRRLGLSNKLNINSKMRFSSVATRTVIEKYTYYLGLKDHLKKISPYNKLTPLTKSSFDEWWKLLRQEFTYVFGYLSKTEPEYFRTLRDGHNEKAYIKRKLWLQACKQALKVIAEANTKQAAAADSTTTNQKILQDASQGSGS